MNEVIIYILKVIAIQGLLYLFYRLVLRHTGRHTFNRSYLLLALIGSFSIPFIELSLPEKAQTLDEISAFLWLSEPAAGLEEFELIPVEQESSNTYWHLIPWLYGAIALALFIRSIFYLALLARLKRHSEYVKKHWFKLFKISQDRPFSFFSNVFMPKSLFGTEAFDQILAHECEHVRQLHSIDRLLMDFVVSLFWFNPFIYLYRNALIEIHEFQADEVVLNRFKDPVGYQEILFSQLQSAQYSGLVSHFNFSMIKKRIVMMNKKRKMTGWVYALTAPVTLMVVFAFSNKEAMEPLNEMGDEIAAIIEPKAERESPESTSSENQSESQHKELSGETQDYTPSILPLSETDMVRMPSGFGMRIHPIEKVKKMHLGMDFSCPKGTEIIATANGKVTGVETKKGGYGKLITIAHGDTYTTRYAQLSEFKVKEGDHVKKGDVIGLSGSSGASTGPHLHYEVIKIDRHVDPMKFIKDYNFKAKLEPKSEPLQKQEQELAEQEEVLAQQYRELAEQEEVMARDDQEQEQQEITLAQKEAEMAQVEQVQAEEMRIADQHLQREDEERKLMELRIINEKIILEDSEQGTELRISGTDKDPLFVIDGEVISKISDLDPEDIARIDILKGKRAKAKYGNKAKNGVVEITTKDKEKNKIKNKPKQKSKDKPKDKTKSKEIKAAEFSRAELIKTQSELAELGYFESKKTNSVKKD